MLTRSSYGLRSGRGRRDHEAARLLAAHDPMVIFEIFVDVVEYVTRGREAQQLGQHARERLQQLPLGHAARQAARKRGASEQSALCYEMRALTWPAPWSRFLRQRAKRARVKAVRVLVRRRWPLTAADGFARGAPRLLSLSNSVQNENRRRQSVCEKRTSYGSDVSTSKPTKPTKDDRSKWLSPLCSVANASQLRVARRETAPTCGAHVASWRTWVSLACREAYLVDYLRKREGVRRGGKARG